MASVCARGMGNVRFERAVSFVAGSWRVGGRLCESLWVA